MSRDAIFSMDLNGNRRQFVTACLGPGATDPEVSPDGRILSFTCFNETGDQAVFDVRVDGSHLRQITPFALHVGSSRTGPLTGDESRSSAPTTRALPTRR